MREFDQLASLAKDDEEKLEQLIHKCEFFIMKTASKVSKRYISKEDDEFQIALLGFSEAVQEYEMDKGSFFSYAELVMRRRLIDYFRSQAKYAVEFSVSPYVFSSDVEETDMQVYKAVNESLVYEEDNTSHDIKDEIASLKEVLKKYGFSFMDLADCSPKAEKTKKQCALACIFMLDNPMLVENLRTTKQFPLKIIQNNCNVSRKTLERHRKYLIAAVEILSGNFPYMKEYLRYIEEVRRNESGRS